MTKVFIPFQNPAANRIWLFGVLAWGALVAAGVNMLWAYRDTPGASAVAPAAWPADCSVTRAEDRATLVMLAHPKCPCTRASVKELAHLMPLFNGQVAAHVLLLKLGEYGENWEKTETWDAAQQIPGVTVTADPEGREADRFGAVTSGQVLLYDKTGHLLFSGGITPGRGHEGNSAGRQRILAILNSGKAAVSTNLVYGCALVSK